MCIALNHFLKAEDVFSAPLKSRALCYASLNLEFHEYLWSHNSGKAWDREGYITQTTNI